MYHNRCAKILIFVKFYNKLQIFVNLIPNSMANCAIMSIKMSNWHIFIFGIMVDIDVGSMVTVTA